MLVVGGVGLERVIIMWLKWVVRGGCLMVHRSTNKRNNTTISYICSLNNFMIYYTS